MGNKMCKKKLDCVDGGSCKSPTPFDRIINRLHVSFFCDYSWKAAMVESLCESRLGAGNTFLNQMHTVKYQWSDTMKILTILLDFICTSVLEVNNTIQILTSRNNKQMKGLPNEKITIKTY